MDPRRQQHQPSTPVAPTPVYPALASRLHVRILIILLIILSVCGIVGFGLKAAGAIMANSSVKSNQFQAVFLANGQVYFGKLSHIDSGYVTMTNIFYLQVNNNNTQTSGQPSTSTSNQLIKLGNELHGPEDAMYINRSQILFWENLKNSGKVVQTIQTYQSSHK